MSAPIQTIEKKVVVIYLAEFYFLTRAEALSFVLPKKFAKMGMNFIMRERALNTEIPIRRGTYITNDIDVEAFCAKRVFISINRAPSIGQYYRIAQL